MYLRANVDGGDVVMLGGKEGDESKAKSHQHVKDRSCVACCEGHVAFSCLCDGAVCEEIADGVPPCKHRQTKHSLWNPCYGASTVKNIDQFPSKDVNPEDANDQAVKCNQ